MRWRVLAPLALLAALLAGCWSRREPEQLARIDVAALDRLADGRVRWTVELPLPAATGAAEVRQSGGGEPPAQRLRAEGSTPAEAETQLARSIGRELFWGHADFFLVGEEQAVHGLAPLLDFIARRYQVRRNSLLFVTRGPAGELLERADTGVSRTTAEFLRNLTRAMRAEAVRAVDANTFLRLRQEPGVDPILPILAPVPAGRGVRPAGDGLAVFMGDRLVASFPEPAGRGVHWMRGDAGVVDLTVPCPQSAAPDRSLTVRVFRVTSSLRVDPDGPVAAVRIRAAGNLIEWDCGLALDPEAVASAERAVAGRIRDEVREALARIRAHRVDPVGFGAWLHRHDPMTWRDLEAGWRDALARLAVDVAVEVTLRSPGLTTGPP